MGEIDAMTATEMVAAVRAGQVSRRELLEAHVERIGRINPVINALVELRIEQALADAEEADRRHDERADLPLDGVPITLKDHFDVAGMLHTEGVAALSERRSTTDAVMVQRLKAAGAIIVGKGNQPDFQIRGNTLNDVYGRTLNPRNLAAAPGGSSGGDAAAVASGMAGLGFGADYGGSIRLPAACCEIYGLRPSAGVVPQVDEFEPQDSPLTVDQMSTNGPLARSIHDLALALKVIAGPHPLDPATVPVAVRDPAEARPARVALMLHQTGAAVEPAIESRVREAARTLEDAGYQVEDSVEIPGAERAPDVWRQLLGTELMSLAWDQWKSLVCDTSAAFITGLFSRELAGEVFPYAAAHVERRGLVRRTAEWMQSYPLVLAPVEGWPTPRVDWDDFMSSEEMEDWFIHYRNVVWVNCLGLPAVALPNGVQVIARRFHDHEALAAAEVLEGALGECTPSDPTAQPSAG